MSHTPVQLLEPGFQWERQSQDSQLRYVVKLSGSDRYSYHFQLELHGRLLSFALNDIHLGTSASADVVREEDCELKSMHMECWVPGYGRTIVWDHGIYRSKDGTAEDVYRQLSRGTLEIDLDGVRLNGRFRLSKRDQQWKFQCLASRSSLPHCNRSVLSGRTLDESKHRVVAQQSQFLLWLEWEHYYADPLSVPQVVIEKKAVIDLNFAAKTKGISVGMPLQHVLPLVPGCIVRAFSADPARQKAWLDLLVPYTDTIQPLSERSAVVDLSAHPEPNEIASKLVAHLVAHAFGHLRYGFGPSIWIAELAARQSNPYGYVQDTAFKLAFQPVECLLSIAPDIRLKLKSLGIDTIGSLGGVNPATLRNQFGAEAHRIITAAKGKTRDQVAALYPPGAVSQSLRFESAVNDSVTLGTAITTLATKLAERVAGQQAGLVILTAEREDGTFKTLERTYNRPLHSPDRIEASLSYLVGELQKDCPDIVCLTARLDQLEPIKTSQQDLFAALTYIDRHAAVTALGTSLGAKSIVLASQIEQPRREQVLKAWRHATGWN